MISRIILYTFVFMFALLLQSSLLRFETINNVSPDLVAVLAVFIGLHQRNLAGLFVCFFIGLLADTFSALYLGPQAAGCVLIFYASGVIASRVYAESSLAIISVTASCVFIKTCVYWALVSFYSLNMSLVEILSANVFFEVVITALLAPPLFKLLRFFSPDTKAGTSAGVANSDSRTQRKFRYGG